MSWTTPAAIVLAAAAKNGCDDPLKAGDFADPDMLSLRSYFRTQDEAIQHCRSFMASGADWWGQGYVYREEYTRRHGWVQRHKWFVSDTGVDADEPVDDD